MGIKKECVDRILERSETDPLDLVNIITSFSSEPRREGASWKTACPLCGADHALVITPGRRVFKCFNCNDLSGKRPLDYLMKGQRMSFPDAVEWLANYYGILLEYDEPVRKASAGKEKQHKESFCRRMLRDSGLTEQDVTATVVDISDSQTKFKQRTFTPGTVNGRGEIDESGDDVSVRASRQRQTGNEVQVSGRSAYIHLHTAEDPHAVPDQKGNPDIVYPGRGEEGGESLQAWH